MQITDSTFRIVRMPRLWALALVVLVFVMSLIAGCGPGRQSSQVTLTYMAWGRVENIAIEKELCRRFEKTHPNIKINVNMTPWQGYSEKLMIMLASHTAADVMRVDSTQFPFLAKCGYFLPIDHLIKEDKSFDLSDFFPQTLTESTFAGRLYGMNVSFGPIIMYYNKTMFDEANLPTPYELYKRGEWTYEKFVEVGQKLTKKDASGIPTQVGYMPSSVLMDMDANLFIYGFGGDLLSGELKKCILSTVPCINGLQFTRDLRYKYGITTMVGEGMNSQFVFESGRCGMLFTWSGSIPVFRKNCQDFEWDVAPVPAGPAGRFTTIQGNQLLISAESKHPRESWEFVKYMVNPEVQQYLYGRLRRAFPTRKSVAFSKEYLETDLPPRNTDVFWDSVKCGRVLPPSERYDQWMVEYRAGLDRLWINEATAEQAAKWMACRIDRVINEDEW